MLSDSGAPCTSAHRGPHLSQATSLHHEPASRQVMCLGALPDPTTTTNLSGDVVGLATSCQSSTDLLAAHLGRVGRPSASPVLQLPLRGRPSDHDKQAEKAVAPTCRHGVTCGAGRHGRLHSADWSDCCCGARARQSPSRGGAAQCKLPCRAPVPWRHTPALAPGHGLSETCSSLCSLSVE